MKKTLILSKSNYITYLKHPAWLWLEKNDKGKLPVIDDDTQAVFDAGNLFEQYAEQLFPMGVKLGYKTNGLFNGAKYRSLPVATQKALDEGVPVLFQGRVEVDGMTCIFDVLERNSSGSYNLYEIKSSTKAKPEHEHDLAFQTLVLERSGLTIEHIYVVHVNSEYVRSGEIIPEEITDTTEVTSAVRDLMDFTNDEVEKAKNVLALSEMPDPSPRFARNGAFGEWLKIYRSLVGIVSPLSIYNVSGFGARKIGELEDIGVTEIDQILDEFALSPRLQAMVESAKRGERIVDIDKVKQFIGTVQYPIYLFDYETFSAVVPPFDGLRPYQQVPFQYSLHVIESPGAQPIHKEYLHTENTLSVDSLLKQLAQDIGPEGTVLVWHQTFEKGRNAEMAKIAPEYNIFLYELNDRIVDLKIPFSEGWFVDSRFKASASIKDVLPVLAPDLSYKELEVQNGNTAQRLWMETIQGGKNEREKEKMMDDLREYCKLDTYAMVRIWEVLQEV